MLLSTAVAGQTTTFDFSGPSHSEAPGLTGHDPSAAAAALRRDLVEGFDPFEGVETPLGYSPDAVGAALLRITPGIDNVDLSTYAAHSFVMSNVGDKEIVAIHIDVSAALFPDMVFDPFGLAGDTLAKPLIINNPGGTGPVPPSAYDPYIGPGGVEGYRQLLFLYDLGVANGFNPGESMTFSIDMDPNSLSGFNFKLLFEGSPYYWDTGGVSGAELIGSHFTALFADGSRATGQIMGDGSQAGGQALATEAPPLGAVSLWVNGVSPGGAGVYGGAPPLVIVDGPEGQTARVVLTRGVIMPNEGPAAETVASRLADAPFLANNAVEFQFVDILLTGAPQNISALFDYVSPPNGFDIDLAAISLGFTAGVIDPEADGLPRGPVTSAIHLRPAGEPVDPGVVLFDATLRGLGPDGAPAVLMTVDGVVGVGDGLVDRPDPDAPGEAIAIEFETPAAQVAVSVVGAGEIAVRYSLYDDLRRILETGAVSRTAVDGAAQFQFAHPAGIGALSLEAVSASFGISAIVTDADPLPDPPPPVGGSLIAAINAGGTALTVGGVDFAQDFRANPYALAPGSMNRAWTYDVAPVGLDGAQQMLLQSERFGDFAYAIDVTAHGGQAGGAYRVTLQFVELSSTVNAAGDRLFDVAIEDMVVLDSFDILDAAGAKGVLVERSFVVELAEDDAVLDIAFTSLVENAKVSAILVEALPDPLAGGMLSIDMLL